MFGGYSLLRLTACVLLPVALSSHLAGAAPEVRARAIFDDGMAIRSDLRGAYLHGVDGVQCVFFDPAQGGSGDFRLDVAFRPARNPRSLYYAFGTPITVCAVSPGGSLPTSGYRRAAMTVGGLRWPVYTMPPGEAQPAWIWNGIPEGRLRFSTAPGWSDAYCSTAALVRRSTDGKTWWIETTVTPGPPATGDTPVLLQYIGRQWLPTSYWHLPFRVEITLW